MQSLPLLIAWRYLNQQEKNISTMIWVCLIGIIIGTFALTLIVSVMNGFEKETSKKMQNIHSQIIMEANGSQLDYEKIKEILKDFDSIEAFSPNNSEQVILETKNVVALKGIDTNERKINNLEEKLIAGNLQLLGNNILVGEKLCSDNNLYLGSELTFLFTHGGMSFQEANTVVGGIFKTGIDEFDSSLIFCSLDFMNQLFPDSGITQVGIKLKNGTNESEVIKKLKERFQISVYSWRDLYPALVSALKLEKYVMFLILALITLVASMNIISLLFMQITRKRTDIAILKSMGLSDAKISSIFLLMGLAISFMATLIGLFLAFLAGYFLHKYPFITLPDVYYVTYLPVHMELKIFITVFIVVILLGLISTFIPARKACKINVSNILRFEG